MPEGTPTTRRWPSAREVAQKLRIGFKEKLPDLPNRWWQDDATIDEVLEYAYEIMGWDTERKISRLTEKLKDAIHVGAFGPLVIPNTVDVNGQPILTPVGEIAMALRDIYSEEFLEMFDEEGEPLDPGSVGG